MDASRLKEEARTLFLRRQYGRCAQVYQRLTALEPGDAHLHLRQAEAERRAGQSQLAAACYRRAAELFRRQGHAARACAALRLALGLEPGHAAAGASLAALEQARQEARSQQRAAAEEVVVELTLEEAEGEAPLEVRRLSDCAVAVRSGAAGPWLLLQSQSPLQTCFSASPEAATAPPPPSVPEDLTSEYDFESLYPIGGRDRVQACRPPAVIALP